MPWQALLASKQSVDSVAAHSCCCETIFFLVLPILPHHAKKNIVSPLQSLAHCQWQSDPKHYGTCFSHARACEQASKHTNNHVLQQARKGGRVKYCKGRVCGSSLVHLHNDHHHGRAILPSLITSLALQGEFTHTFSSSSSFSSTFLLHIYINTRCSLLIQTALHFPSKPRLRLLDT